MKNKLIRALPVILAGVLTACQQQEKDVEPAASLSGNPVIVHFISSPLETKTAFAEPSVEDGIATYPTRWTDNDTFVAVSLNYAAAVQAGVQPSGDYTTAEFDADFTGVEAAAPYTFYVVSPASALASVSPSRKALALTVPSRQVPLATSADEAAQILFAQSAAAETLPEKVDVHFSHVTGYGRLTIKGLPEGVSVSSVSLVSKDQPWAGTWYYDPTTRTLEAKEASSTITVETDAVGDIWFACAPVDMKGKTLGIAVNTDAGVFQREIVLNGKNVDFSSGHVYKFSVNMDGIEPVRSTKVYRLVTDASALEAGKEVLLVNSDATYAAGSAAGTTRTAVSVTVTDGAIDGATLPSTVEVYTLETGSTAGTWSFRNSSGYYLTTTNSTNNNNNILQTTATKDGWGSWYVSCGSDGSAVIRAASTASTLLTTYYRHIRFYSSNNTRRFSAYRSTDANSCSSSNTSAVALYMEDYTGGAAIDDPILEKEDYGIYLPSLTHTYTRGSDQLSREYEGSTLTFAILTPAEYAILECSGIPVSAVTGDTFPLTVTQRRGRSVLFTASYDVTVAGEAGAKLWLSDGAGHGFIVKR